ncbi:MAG TPA: hypothetical protein VEV45_20600 [Streptosporangiaceae bacterium]|nr:hypothetical protein [Streptosporangiaceae bacterium]
MATFSQWLVAQESTGQPWSPLGALWHEAAKRRPRTSGTASVTKWLVEHAEEAQLTAEEASAALDGAKAAFDGARGHLQVAPLPAAAEQPEQEPGPSAAHPASMPAIMASLGRIEEKLAKLVVDHRRTAQGVGENHARLVAVEKMLDEAAQERAPLRELLAELGAAEATADAADEAYAAGDLDQAAQLAGIHPGLLYGDHHAPGALDGRAAWQAAYDAGPAEEGPPE